MHMEHYFNYDQETEFCKVVGFLDQYTGFTQLVVTFGTVLFLFFKVVTVAGIKTDYNRYSCCKNKYRILCKFAPLEVGFLAFSFLFSLVVSSLPFALDLTAYGETGPWCWIKSFDMNCTQDTNGFWEQIGLWYIPFGIVGLFSFALMAVISTMFCWWRMKFNKGTVKPNVMDKIKRMLIESVIMLFFLLSYCGLCAIEISVRIFTFVSNKVLYWLWVMYAVSTPLSGAIMPVAFFVYFYVVIPKFGKGSARPEEVQALCSGEEGVGPPVPNQSSITHWDPPHEDEVEND